jgi:hypothetical protein
MGASQYEETFDLVIIGAGELGPRPALLAAHRNTGS